MTEGPPLVLVNAIHAKTGGGRVYLDEVVPRAARLPGARYVALERPSQAPYSLRRSGVEVREVNAPESPLASFLWDQTALVRIARRERAALVFMHASFGPIALGGRSLVLLGNTFQAARANRSPYARVYWRALEMACRASVRAAGGALVISASFRSEVAARLGVPEASFRVVLHGRSERFCSDPAPEDGEIAPSGRYVLVVGDAYPHKNLETAIEAFARIAPARPELRLVLVGSDLDPAYSARIKAMAQDILPAGRIAFLGPRPQAHLPALYRRAACVLFLSVAEAFGLTQVEALACGAPLVASDIPVVREISGDAAVLVPPRDVAAVAGAVERILSDPELRMGLRRRAIERGALFSWDRTAERLHEEVLRRIAELNGN